MTIVFDADDDDTDLALVNSHWVAERTAHRIGAEVRTYRGASVTRAQMEHTLADASVTGVVYCGHGRAEALVYQDDAVLDLDNLAHIGSRWFHAFACNSGNRLAPTAPREGVGAYLGYNRPVIVEWTVDQLPEEVCAILEDIVTVATLRLHGGERSRNALRNAVEDAYDSWIVWCATHADAPLELNEQLGLHALRRLFECMELHGQHVTG